jgi:peptidoglycan hydrolase-like protein with peptidoglycan-binding domain
MNQIAVAIDNPARGIALNVVAFPGALRAGDGRPILVALVQSRLNHIGSLPLVEDGRFGAETRAAVQSFQQQRGLVADGIVGAATWSRLFETAPLPPPPSGRFASEVLRVAAAEVGVRERGGPNRGPRVDEYLRAVGLDPTRGAYAWCASFVYFCFGRAAIALGLSNPCVKTAACMTHWRRARATARIASSDVSDNTAVIRPGAIFIIDHGKGQGHTGIVERATASAIHTIEGNTNAGGSREGDGVYRRIRPSTAINAGYIDYTRVGTGGTSEGGLS